MTINEIRPQLVHIWLLNHFTVDELKRLVYDTELGKNECTQWTPRSDIAYAIVSDAVMTKRVPELATTILGLKMFLNEKP